MSAALRWSLGRRAAGSRLLAPARSRGVGFHWGGLALPNFALAHARSLEWCAALPTGSLQRLAGPRVARAHRAAGGSGGVGAGQIDVFCFVFCLGLQEATAVAMADGFAQATRRPTLVSLHTAAGIGNGMGNIMTAFMNKTPLIITAGQQTRERLPLHPVLPVAIAGSRWSPLSHHPGGIAQQRAHRSPTVFAYDFHQRLLCLVPLWLSILD